MLGRRLVAMLALENHSTDLEHHGAMADPTLPPVTTSPKTWRQAWRLRPFIVPPKGPSQTSARMARPISPMETDGSIYISGSGTLVRALLKDGLVDDLHGFVYPVALGRGKRLWDEGADPVRLALKVHEAYDNGVAHVVYGLAWPPLIKGVKADRSRSRRGQESRRPKA